METILTHYRNKLTNLLDTFSLQVHNLPKCNGLHIVEMGKKKHKVATVSSVDYLFEQKVINHLDLALADVEEKVATKLGVNSDTLVSDVMHWIADGKPLPAPRHSDELIALGKFQWELTKAIDALVFMEVSLPRFNIYATRNPLPPTDGWIPLETVISKVKEIMLDMPYWDDDTMEEDGYEIFAMHPDLRRNLQEEFEEEDAMSLIYEMPDENGEYEWEADFDIDIHR